MDLDVEKMALAQLICLRFYEFEAPLELVIFHHNSEWDYIPPN